MERRTLKTTGFPGAGDAEGATKFVRREKTGSQL